MLPAQPSAYLSKAHACADCDPYSFDATRSIETRPLHSWLAGLSSRIYQKKGEFMPGLCRPYVRDVFGVGWGGATREWLWAKQTSMCPHPLNSPGGV